MIFAYYDKLIHNLNSRNKPEIILLILITNRKKMRDIKQIWIVAASSLLIGIMVLLTSTAIAGEPLDVIEKSKSYPSGRHFNLTPQGKDPLSFFCKEMLQTGKSISIDEYGESTTQYMTNKRSPVTDLTVLEPYAGCFNDPADDSLPTLGPSNIRYVYNATPEKFVTFDSATSEGKEKVKAVNITHLFKFLDRFCEASIVDTNEDGEIVGYGFTFVIKF
ncbi:MAG: hypothetical protein U9N83_12920 [Thermodesulfobacteriota bacterium]|nr:hypothetical protein [Thermodesulfobacteriota bacterium]